MKKNLMYVLILFTAAGITVAGILSGQQFIRMLPLYISLMVMFFQSDALRIAPLIGSLNSLLYAYVDYSYNLFGSALSALLISFPFQMLTFILWTKRKDGKTTVFRKMSPKKRILFFLAVAIVYVPCLVVNFNMGAALAPLDTYSFVGVFATQILTLFAFIEYTWFSVFGSLITILMNALILKSSPDRACYLIYSIYSAICCIRGAVTVYKIHKRQNTYENILLKSEDTK
jgi:nicotinamide riboside transporter PnuC